MGEGQALHLRCPQMVGAERTPRALPEAAVSLQDHGSLRLVLSPVHWASMRQANQPSRWPQGQLSSALPPVPLCCPPLPKSLSTKGGGRFPSLTLLPGTEDRAGAVGVPDCGPRQGSPQWEVNEHHLGYHDLFLLHCLQRQVGTTWRLVGARMGGSSSVR